MTCETPEARNAEISRIVWALQDNAKSLDELLKHGREAKIDSHRFADLTMARHGISDALQFLRHAAVTPEVQP